MLTITGIANADYYLGGPCGAHFHGAGKDQKQPEPADYYTNSEQPGRWSWRGVNALGLTGEIVPEGPSGDAFRSLVNDLRDPTKPKVWEKDKSLPAGGAWRHPRLGRKPQEFKPIEQRVAAWVKKHPHATVEEINAYRVEAEKDQREAKNAWDFTFSPPKSWSVAYIALLQAKRFDEAKKLKAAWEAGVHAAFDVLFDELSFVRSGAAGPKVNDRSTTHYARPKNLQLALFWHHTSRDGDPQIHIHGMVLNRALTESEVWQALYSPAFTKAKHMMDAVAERVAEGHASRELGFTFEATGEGHREIVGVSPEVRDLFSSRTRALTEKAQEKLDEYVRTKKLDDASQVPTRVKWRIFKRATLDTRKPKPKTAPTQEEDLFRWEEEARREVRESLDDVMARVDENSADVIEVPVWDERLVIEQALVDLEDRKGTFNKSQLMFAINKRLPAMLAVEPEDVPKLLSDLAEEAIRSASVVSTEAKPVVPVPGSLRDGKSGRSVFEAPEGRRFTTRKHLARETSMVVRLDHVGAPKVTTERANALLAKAGLFDEQQQVGANVLSSGYRMEVIDAAGGTGKSRTLKAISDAAEAQWGVGITGFAMSQNAANVLAGEGVARAHNVKRFLNFVEREKRGEVTDVERAKFSITPGSYVAIDEVGTLDTPLLTELLSTLDELGVSKVILVGDTEQVDSVDAGGAFSLLVGEVRRRDREAQKALPPAQPQAGEQSIAAWTGEGRPEREPVPVPRLQKLTQVRRFSHAWERQASAELREGKVEALTQYKARGRVKGSSDPNELRDIAVKGFVTDWLSGRDSIILTRTTEKAEEYASYVHEELVKAGHVAAEGVVLRGKTIVSVGDVVQTRENSQSLNVSNRDLWQVVGTDSAGALEVRPLLGRDEAGEQQYGEVKQLPAEYTQQQIELGYAGATLGKQGVTIKGGSSWTVVDRAMGQSHTYMAMGRGTEANHAVVELEPVAPQRHNEPDEAYEARVRRETPLGRLAEVFSKDDHAKAATMEIAAEEARATNLGHLTPQWEWTIRETRAITHRAILQETLGKDADKVLADPASNKVFNQLRTAELTGHDPREVLQAVRATRDLEGAKFPAQLLYAQIDDELATGPLAKPIPMTFESRVPKTALGEPENERLAFARATGRAMDDRAAELGRLQAEDPEEWAVRALGPVPEDEIARGGWIGRVALAAAYREAYGWDDSKDVIGRKPVHAEPERAWLWDLSARLIGMPDSERDLQGRSDAELANRVQDWERAQVWGPPNRDAELREAHLALEEARFQVVQARAAGREDIAELEADQAEMQALVGKYETVATARAAWYEATRTERERAEEARQEKDRRAEVEQARAGTLPVVDDPETDVKQEMDDADVHAAVFERWQQHHVPDLKTLFGSPRWVELDDDHPEKQAAVTAAANRAWNFGAWLEQDADKVTERLAEHGLDERPDDYLTTRALERIREDRAAGERTEDWDYIGPMTREETKRAEAPVQDEPAPDGDLLAAVFAWAQPHLEGEAPEYGTAAYAQADEPEKVKAEARAALSWWRAGDDLDERAARAEYADLVATRNEVSAAMEARREEQRQAAIQERTEANRAERDRVAEWEREYARDGIAAIEERDSEGYDPNLESEPAEAKVEPQPSLEPVSVSSNETEHHVIDPADDRHEPVEWPEVKAPPEPEVEEPVEEDVDEPEQPDGPVMEEPEEPKGIDRSSYQHLLDAAEQHKAEAEVEPEPVKDDPQPESDTEPEVDPKAERDAQLQADLEKAREATAKLEEMQRPDPEPDAPKPTQSEPERELADD